MDGKERGRERVPRTKWVISLKELGNTITLGSHARLYQILTRKRIANKID